MNTKCGSKDIYNVTKQNLFQINAVLPEKKNHSFHNNINKHNCYQHW